MLRYAARGLRRASTSTVAPEALERKFLLGNYSADGVRMAPGLVFERGAGCKLYDADGAEYLDFFAGIAVNALGHSDEGVAAVIAAQARKVQHVSNILHTREPLELAQLLVSTAPYFGKAFLCNSGTEANEAALKFARKFALHAARKHAAGIPAGSSEDPPPFTAFACKSAVPTACMTQGGSCSCWPQVANNDVALAVRNEVIAFKNSFHGRTMGALAVTHKPAIRYPFAPFPAEARFARFNVIGDVLKQWTPRVGTVIVEPVQGEAGVVPADRAFLRDLRALCTERGALLIMDEVQCGVGRSGRLWAHEAYGDECLPDMLTLAKPLAGGLPVGAVLMTDAVAATIKPGDHGTTFGGNPFIAAAAVHVLKRINEPSFLASVRARGAQLLKGCRALAAAHPHAISDVRGTLGDEGLFVGVELKQPFKALQAAALKRKLLIISGGENAIRICPPLIISESEIAHGLSVLDAALKEAYPA